MRLKWGCAWIFEPILMDFYSFFLVKMQKGHYAWTFVMCRGEREQLKNLGRRVAKIRRGSKGFWCWGVVKKPTFMRGPLCNSYPCWYFSISLLPDKLGEGEFGEVYEATLLGDVRGQSFAGLTVAVKGLKGRNSSSISTVPFESGILPPLKHAYIWGIATGHHASRQEVSWCCTRSESEGTHITYVSAKYE